MKDKKAIHFCIAIVLDILICLLIPAANGLTEIGVRTIGAAVATVYLWTFVATDWTSIFSALLFAIAGVMPFGTLITTGATPVMLIIVMSAVTLPLSKTGFIARVINWFVSRKFLRGRPWLFFAFYFAAIYIIGCFLDVAACCLIALPVARELCREIGYEDDSKFASCMYLGIIWYSMWGYAATPIAHTVSIIIMGLVETYTGTAISMLNFMAVGIPSTIVLGILSFLVMRFVVRPDVSRFVNYDPESRARQHSRKMGRGEKSAVIIFCLVVAAILFPDICRGIFPDAAAFVSGLTINAPAVAGIAANIGIMTPAASAATAVVLGSGASTSHAIKYGAIMIPIAVALCIVLVYPLSTLILA